MFIYTCFSFLRLTFELFVRFRLIHFRLVVTLLPHLSEPNSLNFILYIVMVDMKVCSCGSQHWCPHRGPRRHRHQHRYIPRKPMYNRPYWPAFLRTRGRQALFRFCPWCDLEEQIEAFTQWSVEELVCRLCAHPPNSPHSSG